jgi:Holliday junction resolvase-like predicted endonuclease
MQTTQIGDRGEQIASEALVRSGYEIIDRNWKTKWCEIDIVATKSNTAYFIEVKYRSTSRQGDGFDYLTDQKLHHMQRAAELWVGIHNWNGPYELLGASVAGNSNNVDIREIA